MSRKKKVMGVCHICGDYTELTFEHVPPEAAFNDRKVIQPKFEDVIKMDDLDDLDRLKGMQSQRGIGGYTLCSDCNSKTGAWYGNAFVDWVYQGLQISDYASHAPSLFYTFRIFPLRIIKQIVSMFFSVNPHGFGYANEDLVRFVLNRESKYLKPKFKFYMCFNLSDRSRQSGVSGMLSLNDGVAMRAFSEISFVPFTYVMCLDSTPPDKRLVDISFFANYGFNDWKDVQMRIPVLPIYTWIPGDYRSRETVLEQHAK